MVRTVGSFDHRRCAGGALLVASAALLPLLAPSSTRAYRTFADDPDVGHAARWPDRTLEWDISTAEITAFDPDQLELAARRAFATWEATDCMPFSTILTGVVPSAAAPNDGRSSIAVIGADWVGRGFPAGRGATADVEIELSEDGTARIVEADIYLNFAEHDFVIGSPGPGQLDLQAVLTHELGHWLGLQHPCETAGADGAPSCGSDVAFSESSLYPEYLGESARVLSPDDIAGICFLYPPSFIPCEPTCEGGLVCRDGACEEVAPCTGATCSPERCGPGGACDRGICAAAGALEDHCLAPGDVGTPCAAASECNGGLCLTSMREGSYCTVACVDDSSCSGMQRCASVAGRRVCAPLESASSCSLAGGRRSAPPGLALGAIIFCLLARRSYARRARSRK